MFYNNYVDLCNKKGMSPSAAAEAMGFKRSVVTRWANGTQPRQATLQKIASFFGCTVEELTKEKAPSDSGEREIGFDDFTFAMHNHSGVLTQKDKDILLSLAQQLADAHRKKEPDGETDGDL